MLGGFGVGLMQLPAFNLHNAGRVNTFWRNVFSGLRGMTAKGKPRQVEPSAWAASHPTSAIAEVENTAIPK